MTRPALLPFELFDCHTNCPIVQSLFHSFLSSPGNEGPLLALSNSRGCCLGTVLPATILWRPGLGGRSSFFGLYGILFLRTLALMLHQVSFPVKSSQFLRRGWAALPLVPLLLSSRLGVAARAPPCPGHLTQPFGRLRAGSASLPMCILL